MNPLPTVTELTNLNEFQIPIVDMILLAQQKMHTRIEA